MATPNGSPAQLFNEELKRPPLLIARLVQTVVQSVAANDYPTVLFDTPALFDEGGLEAVDEESNPCLQATTNGAYSVEFGYQQDIVNGSTYMTLEVIGQDGTSSEFYRYRFVNVRSIRDSTDMLLRAGERVIMKIDNSAHGGIVNTEATEVPFYLQLWMRQEGA